MKVCDITQFWSPASGGVRRYISEKVRHLRALGGCHVLIIPGERDAVEGDDSARVYTIASPHISKVTGYRVLLRLAEIERILSAERPDIVECGDPYQVGWRTARACGWLGIPAVAFYHSHFAESELRPLGEKIARTVGDWLVMLAAKYSGALYNRYARTLVPSPLLASTLCEWGVMNTEPVDLGVDTELFRPATQSKDELHTQLDIPANVRVLLSVGRLAAEKGTRELCEAFRLLHARNLGEFHLIITGEGLQRASVERLCAETGAVTWLPYLSGHVELLRLYHAADLFVHPGVRETFGLVTLEAQACALPVVGFRGTAMDRIVCHDQSFWASAHTPKALADAIEKACAHNLPTMGAAAREKVSAQFAWSRVFARQFEIYRDVIANSSRCV